VILPLPVDRLWGVGKKTADRLKAAGLYTISDVRRSGQAKMVGLLGSMGDFIYELSCGRDEREVESQWERKSVGTERTFAEDIELIPPLLEVLSELSQEVSEYLQERNWYAMTFTLKLKYHDFKQITRSTTLSIPSYQATIIEERLKRLLIEKTDAGRVPVRLIGVSASGFIREEDPLQLYFDFMEKN
jgi:DNA polymerase IV